MGVDNWQRCYLCSNSRIAMAVLSVRNDGNFKRFLTCSTSQTIKPCCHNFMIRPSAGVCESRTLSSIYYYELLVIANTVYY